MFEIFFLRRPAILSPPTFALKLPFGSTGNQDMDVSVVLDTCALSLSRSLAFSSSVCVRTSVCIRISKTCTSFFNVNAWKKRTVVMFFSFIPERLPTLSRWIRPAFSSALIAHDKRRTNWRAAECPNAGRIFPLVSIPSILRRRLARQCCVIVPFVSIALSRSHFSFFFFFFVFVIGNESVSIVYGVFVSLALEKENRREDEKEDWEWHSKKTTRVLWLFAHTPNERTRHTSVTEAIFIVTCLWNSTNLTEFHSPRFFKVLG